MQTTERPVVALVVGALILGVGPTKRHGLGSTLRERRLAKANRLVAAATVGRIHDQLRVDQRTGTQPAARGHGDRRRPSTLPDARAVRDQWIWIGCLDRIGRSRRYCARRCCDAEERQADERARAMKEETLRQEHARHGARCRASMAESRCGSRLVRHARLSNREVGGRIVR